MVGPGASCGASSARFVAERGEGQCVASFQNYLVASISKAAWNFLSLGSLPGSSTPILSPVLRHTSGASRVPLHRVVYEVTICCHWKDLLDLPSWSSYFLGPVLPVTHETGCRQRAEWKLPQASPVRSGQGMVTQCEGIGNSDARC